MPTKRYNIPRTVSNLKHSGKLLLKNQLANMMPSLSDITVSNSEVFSNMKKFDKDNTRSLGRYIATKKKLVMGTLSSVIKNAKEDLRSGKLYNEDRQYEDGNGIESMMQNFDYEPDEGVEYDDPGVSITSKFNQYLNSTAAALSGGTDTLIKGIGETNLQSSEYLADVYTMNTSKILTLSTKHHMEEMKQLQNFQNIGMSLVNFNNEVIAKSIETRDAYLDDILNETRELKESVQKLTEMQTGRFNSTSKILPPGVSQIDQIMGSNGAPNIKEYASHIKKNFKRYVMPFDFNMFAPIMKEYVNNPVGKGIQTLLNMMIPKNTKKAASTLDSTLGSLFSLYLLQMNNIKNKSKDMTIRTLASILGVDMNKPTKPNLAMYKNQDITIETEQMKAKAIIEVIPTYLNSINSALTGINKTYDYNKGRFMDTKKKKKEVMDEFKYNVSSEMQESANALSDSLYKTTLNAAEKAFIDRDINEFMYFCAGMGQQFKPSMSYGKLYKEGLRLTGGEKSYRIIVSLFKSLPKKDQLILQQNQVKSFANRRDVMHNFNTNLQSSGDSALFNGFFDDDYYYNGGQRRGTSSSRNSPSNRRKGRINYYRYGNRIKTKKEAKRSDFTDDILNRVEDELASGNISQEEAERIRRDVLRETEGDDRSFMDVLKDKAKGSLSKMGFKFKERNGKIKSFANGVDAILYTVNDGIYNMFYGGEDGLVDNIQNYGKKMIQDTGKIIFGEWDEKGNQTEEGMLRGKFAAVMKKYMPKAIQGGTIGKLIGGAFKHPIIGATIGGAINILTETSKIKEFLWGDGKDKKGVFGTIKNKLISGIDSLLKKFGAENGLTGVKDFFKEKLGNAKDTINDIVDPIDFDYGSKSRYFKFVKGQGSLKDIASSFSRKPKESVKDNIVNSAERIMTGVESGIYTKQLDTIIDLLQSGVMMQYSDMPEAVSDPIKVKPNTTDSASVAREIKKKVTKSNKKKRVNQQKQARNGNPLIPFNVFADPKKQNIPTPLANKNSRYTTINVNETELEVISAVSKGEMSEEDAAILLASLELYKKNSERRNNNQQPSAVSTNSSQDPINEYIQKYKLNNKHYKFKSSSNNSANTGTNVNNKRSLKDRFSLGNIGEWTKNKLNIDSLSMGKGRGGLLSMALLGLLGHPLMGLAAGMTFFGESNKYKLNKARETAGMSKGQIARRNAGHFLGLGGSTLLYSAIAGMLGLNPLYGVALASVLGGRTKKDKDRKSKGLFETIGDVKMPPILDKITGGGKAKGTALGVLLGSMFGPAGMLIGGGLGRKMSSNEKGKNGSLIDKLTGGGKIKGALVGAALGSFIGNPLLGAALGGALGTRKGQKEKFWNFNSNGQRLSSEQSERKKHMFNLESKYDLERMKDEDPEAYYNAVYDSENFEKNYKGRLKGYKRSVFDRLKTRRNLKRQGEDEVGRAALYKDRSQTGGILNKKLGIGKWKSAMLGGVVGSLLTPLMGPMGTYLGMAAGAALGGKRDQKFWRYDRDGKRVSKEKEAENKKIFKLDTKYDLETLMDKDPETYYNAMFNPDDPETKDKLKDYKRSFFGRMKARRDIKKERNAGLDAREKENEQEQSSKKFDLKNLDKLEIFKGSKGTGVKRGAVAGMSFGGPVGALLGATLGFLSHGKKSKAPDGTAKKPFYVKLFDKHKKNSKSETTEDTSGNSETTGSSEESANPTGIVSKIKNNFKSKMSKIKSPASEAVTKIVKSDDKGDDTKTEKITKQQINAVTNSDNMSSDEKNEAVNTIANVSESVRDTSTTTQGKEKKKYKSIFDLLSEAAGKAKNAASSLLGTGGTGGIISNLLGSKGGLALGAIASVAVPLIIKSIGNKMNEQTQSGHNYTNQYGDQQHASTGDRINSVGSMTGSVMKGTMLAKITDTGKVGQLNNIMTGMAMNGANYYAEEQQAYMDQGDKTGNVAEARYGKVTNTAKAVHYGAQAAGKLIPKVSKFLEKMLAKICKDGKVTKLLQKFNTKVDENLIPKLIEWITKKVLVKLLKKSPKQAAKLATKIASVASIVGAILPVATAVTAFINGWNNYANEMQLSVDYKPSVRERLMCALVYAADDLLCGALDIVNVRPILIKFLIGKEHAADAEQSQAKAKSEYETFLKENDLSRDGFTMEQYQNLTNKTMWGYVKSAFGGNNLDDYKKGGKKYDKVHDKYGGYTEETETSDSAYVIQDNSSVTNVYTSDGTVTGGRGSSQLIKSLFNNKDKKNLTNTFNRFRTSGGRGINVKETVSDTFKNMRTFSNKKNIKTSSFMPKKPRRSGGRGVDVSKWISVVKAVKQAIADSRCGYSQGTKVNITIDGKTKAVRPDCSGLVTACLQFYGVLDDNTYLNTSSMLNSSSPLSGTGFTMKEWSGWDNLSEGDIIVNSNHTEIFSRNDNGVHYVYNCGSDNACNTPGETRDTKEYSVVWSPGKAGTNAVNGTSSSSLNNNNSSYTTTSSTKSNSGIAMLRKAARKPRVTTFMQNKDPEETLMNVTNKDSISNMIESSIENGPNFINGLDDKTKKDIKKSNSKGMTSKFKEGLYNTFSNINSSNNDTGIFGKLKNVGSKIGSGIKNGLTSFGSKIKNFASGAVNKVKGLWNKISGGRGDDPDYYNQQDPRWSNMSFGKYDNHRDTVGDGGCGPTTAATVIQKLTGRTITPAETSKFALNNGYKVDDGGTTPDYFNAIGSKYGVGFNESSPYSRDTINSLKQGNPVVFLGHDSTGTSPFGSDSHYVVGTGIDNKGNINILDPKNRENNRKYNINDIASNAMQSIVPTSGGRGYKKGKGNINELHADDGRVAKSLKEKFLHLTGGRGKGISIIRKLFGGRGTSITIQKETYNWNGELVQRPETSYLVLHHAESSNSATCHDFHQLHLSNGWSGIGYHFVVDRNGTIHTGRPIDAEGAHVGDNNMNSKSIGICAVGNYDSDQNMPNEQLTSIVNLCKWLLTVYPNAAIKGHKEVGNSNCPGKYYPLDKIKNDVGNGGGVTCNQTADSLSLSGTAGAKSSNSASTSSSSSSGGGMVGKISSILDTITNAFGSSSDSGTSSSGGNSTTSGSSSGSTSSSVTGSVNGKDRSSGFGTTDRVGTITVPSGLGSERTYMGWQCIRDKSSDQYKLREESGMHFDSDGYAKIGDRYVVAMTSTYGKIGDYVDIKRSDGSILHAVIGDEKNQNDKGCTAWGHSNGNCIEEFVVDKNSWYKNGVGSHSNPGNPGNHPEWSQLQVTSVENLGNYWGRGGSNKNKIKKMIRDRMGRGGQLIPKLSTINDTITNAFGSSDSSSSSSGTTATSGSNSGSNSTMTGSGKFPKYQLSDDQINGIANIVQHEQGGTEGYYAEASQIANHNDISGDDKATTDQLIKSVTGGWYANGKSRYNSGKNGSTQIDPVAAQSVRDVIVNGKRTLPRYVDEHDYIGDITSISTGSPNNRSDYKQHETVIKNRMGSTYTFYEFPNATSDPFGYINASYRDKYGDNHYDVPSGGRGSSIRLSAPTKYIDNITKINKIRSRRGRGDASINPAVPLARLNDTIASKSYNNISEDIKSIKRNLGNISTKDDKVTETNTNIGVAMLTVLQGIASTLERIERNGVMGSNPIVVGNSSNDNMQASQSYKLDLINDIVSGN